MQENIPKRRMLEKSFSKSTYEVCGYSVRAFSKMVDGLQKIVKPLLNSEDPTQKMVGGKMIFIRKNLHLGMII